MCRYAAPIRRRHAAASTLDGFEVRLERSGAIGRSNLEESCVDLEAGEVSSQGQVVEDVGKIADGSARDRLDDVTQWLLNAFAAEASRERSLLIPKTVERFFSIMTRLIAGAGIATSGRSANGATCSMIGRSTGGGFA